MTVYLHVKWQDLRIDQNSPFTVKQSCSLWFMSGLKNICTFITFTQKIAIIVYYKRKFLLMTDFEEISCCFFLLIYLLSKQIRCHMSWTIARERMASKHILNNVVSVVVNRAYEQYHYRQYSYIFQIVGDMPKPKFCKIPQFLYIAFHNRNKVSESRQFLYNIFIFEAEIILKILIHSFWTNKKTS